MSLDGFEVTWSGYDGAPACGQSVTLAILDMAWDSTGVRVTTENDGAYTFTAEELSPIDPSLMDLRVVLVFEKVSNIDAAQFDPRAWTRVRHVSARQVYVE